jgi:hypothetical protein
MLPFTDQDRFALKATERHLAAALGALPERPGIADLKIVRDAIEGAMDDVGEMLAEAPGECDGDHHEGCRCGSPDQARRSLVAVLARVRDDPGGLTPRETAALRGAVLPALVRAAEGRHPGDDRLDRLDAELHRERSLAEVATHPKAEGEGDDRFHSVNPAVRPMGDGWYEPEFGAARSSERGRP